MVIVTIVVSVVAGDHWIVRVRTAPLIVIELIIVRMIVQVLTSTPLNTMLAYRLAPLHLLLRVVVASSLPTTVMGGPARTPNGHTDTAATKASLGRNATATPLHDHISCARWRPAVIGRVVSTTSTAIVVWEGATRPANSIEAVVLEHLLPSGAHVHVGAEGKAAAHGHQDPHQGGAHATRALLLLGGLTA